MKQNASGKDSAFSVMAMDILSNVLSRADNPGDLGTYLTEQVRDLTGARCVVLIQCPSTPSANAHRVVSVNPSRRREWAKSPAAKRLYEVVHDVPAARLWRGDEPSEASELLRREGFELSMVFPLRAGEFRVGAMLVLGLPDEEHIASALNLLNSLSTIVALALRNVILYDDQAQLIQERTAELRDKNERLNEEIVEREKAEEAMKASEERFRRLAENARDVIYRMSLPDGKYEYVSPAALSMFGYSPEECYRTPMLVKQAIHPDWHKYFEEQWANLIRGELPPTYEYQFIHKSGDVRWLNQRNILVRDAGGKPIAIEGSVTDITERKLAEEEIRKLNQELDQRVRERTAHLETAIEELEAFAYSVAHDLRAPLRGIDGFSQALLEDYSAKLDEKGQDYLRRIRTAAQRMGQLFDDTLSLSRVTRGEMRRETVNLSSLALEIAGELARREPDRKVLLSIAPEAVVTGDARLLRVALENLLGNAWKFTSKRPKAKIEFGVTERGSRRVYFVRDNGVGFSMDYAGRLFGAFQRLHSGDEFPGTGVGLAIVQRIIHRHGGVVWADGEINRGATLYFSLPLKYQGAQPWK